MKRALDRRCLALIATLALAACSAPTVPDFTYYRLPRSAAARSRAGAAVRRSSSSTCSVPTACTRDQALVYALDPGAQQLRQYHYQLWTDPPTRVLQRRLIEQLRDANIARAGHRRTAGEPSGGAHHAA